jgi:hypothetical protein
VAIRADGNVLKECAHWEGRNSRIGKLERRAIDVDGIGLGHVG